MTVTATNIFFQRRHICLSVLLLLFCMAVQAQNNLVPNPGFEQSIKTAPSKDINRKGEPLLLLVDNWYMPTAGTSDFYNSDRSTFVNGQSIKKARTGQGRVGLIVNSKMGGANEYVQARLKEPLKKGSTYCITIHYSLDKRCAYYAEQIGVCLSPEPVASKGSASLYLPGLEDYLVQCGNDSLNRLKKGWQESRQIYVANGEEEYITIGSFSPTRALAVSNDDPAHYPEMDKGLFGRMAYYYLDDISVVEVPDETACMANPDPTPAYNHFVFLVDVSASMEKAGYLSQLKTTLLQFVDTLGKHDLVSLVAFDLRTHVMLRKVEAGNRAQIAAAIDRIQAGTVTNVDKALTVTYTLMDSVRLQDGNNRVVLVSDARFELSTTSKQIIHDHWKNAQIFFSMIQFGEERNKALEKITAKTNGAYTHARQQDLLRALSAQVKKADEDDYTPSRNRNAQGSVFGILEIPGR